MGQPCGLADKSDAAGAFGWAFETQSGLFGSAVALFAVAGRAGGHQIFPGVFASFTARDDMIKSQIRPALAAILAAMIVSEKQVFAVQQNTPGGSFDIPAQADYSRQSKNACDSADAQ